MPSVLTTVAGAVDNPRETARRQAAARGAGSSGCPGELRAREGRLPLVGDAKGVDPRARRMRDRQVRPGRVEDPDEPRRLAALDPERDDVFDLEVDVVAD